MPLHDDIRQLLEFFWGVGSARPASPEYHRLLYIENDSSESETIPVWAITKDGNWRRVGLPANSGIISPARGGFGIDLTTWTDDAIPVWVNGAWRQARFEFSKATEPTINDDSSAGYLIGSMWSTTSGKVFYLVSDAVGAAVWVDLSQSGGSGGSSGGDIQAEDGSSIQAEDGSNIESENSSGGGGSGTVTSVGLALPTELFTVSNSPVTDSGTLTAVFKEHDSGFVFATPDDNDGVPEFRALISTDIPALPASQITSGLLDVARIPALPASKIDSGQLASDRLPDLAPSPAGTYTNADITVDGKGRITTAANGSGGSGSDAQGFHAYESTGNQALTGTYQGITLDTNVKVDSAFSHTAGNADITINTAGWYLVSYHISTKKVTNGTRSTSVARLAKDTGSGFAAIAGTEGWMYNRTDGVGTANAAVTILHEFGAGDKLQLEARDDAGNTIETLADGAGITITALVSGAGGSSSGSADFEITGTASGALGYLDVAYLDDATNVWKLADGDVTPVALSGRLAIVTQSGGIADTASGTLQTGGRIEGFTGLTAGQPVYLDSTPGQLTQTRPDPAVGSGQVAIVRLGFADTATSIVFDPPDRFAYLRRAIMEVNDTLVVQHHADSADHPRRSDAYVSTTIAGSVAVQYDAANQNDTLFLGKFAYSNDITSTSNDIESGHFDGTVVPDNAFDGNGATFWGSATTGNGVNGTAYIGQDFGTTQADWQHVRKVSVQQVADGTNRINSALMQYTDDDPSGSPTWTTVATLTLPLDASAHEHVLPASDAHRAWRLLANAAPGVGRVWGVAEFEMYSDRGTNTRLAQSFEVASTTTIAAVGAWLSKTGTPQDTLTARIETDVSSAPSGTLVTTAATSQKDAADVSASSDELIFNLAGEVSLVAGTYWLVIETDGTPSETDYLAWDTDSSPAYADGEVKSYHDDAWNTESEDAIFAVYQPGTGFSEELITGRWSGGTRDVAVKFDSDTQTTFKNTSGFTLDITAHIEV